MTGFRCLEHEQTLLGALKHDNQAFDEILLSPGDFSEVRNREIFQAIGRILETGRTADDLTITDELRKAQARADAAYVAELPVRSAANIKYYAEQIREAARRRRLYTVGLKLKEKAETGDIDELLGDVEKAITEMYDQEASELLWLADILHPTLRHLDELHGGLSGVPTGFKRLDVATNGFQAGDLIIIGARASIGKTALALTMARKQAKAKYKVGFFTCEMSKIQFVCRLLAAEASLNLLHVNKGLSGSDEHTRLLEAGNRLYTTPILIADMPNPPLAHIRSMARRMKRMGIQIIYVDYLTLIQHGPAQMSRPERVGQISKSLKQLARELNIPIVALSQLNREAEGKTPNLAELRQSGEIEEDSDIVMLLTRNRHPEGEGDDVKRMIPAKIIIAKNRNGPLSTCRCLFERESAQFVEEEEDKYGNKVKN